MSRDKQSSFAGGILSPALYGRTELAKHEVGLAAAFNCIINPEGGVMNRGGTRFAQQSPTTTSGGRLIKFAFNVVQQYCLEFGNLWMRVILNGSYVYEPAVVITGATQANPVVVTAGSHGYANGDEVFISGVGGMTEVNGRSFLVANKTASTFELQDLDGNNINGTGFGAYTSGGTSERVYELTTPYAIADLMADPSDETKPGLKFTQSADVMTITHPDYVTRDLTRTAHDAWTLTEVDFVPDQEEPTVVTVTVNTTGAAKVGYKVTAVNEESGEESLAGLENGGRTINAITQANPAVVTLAAAHPFDVGDEVYIDGGGDMVEVNERRFIVAAVSGNNVTLKDEDATGHTAYTAGGLMFGSYEEVTNSAAFGSEDNTVSWTAATGARTYRVYKRQGGLFGFIGETALTSFEDDGLTPDVADVPPSYRNPFHNSPAGCTTYIEQRQAYGGQSADPQVLNMSQSAAFENFSRSFPGQDSDAIQRRLNADEANAIRHLVPLSDLLVMTSGAEFLVRGVDDVITPSTITSRRQSKHGASNVPPLIVGNMMLFVQRTGRVVRDLGYRPSSDGRVLYSGDDRTILVPHLFEAAKIRDWTYVGEPEHLVWVVKEDGTLAAMTYMLDQDVWAWSSGETRGEVESVCAIEEATGPVVYFLVKRNINGVVKRFIEYLPRRYFDEEADMVFVDSSLSLDAPVTVTGFTNADPVVVTAPAHGFSNGDTVDIAKVKVSPDPSAADATADDDLINPYRYDVINKDGWTAANVTTNTFELQDSDGNNMDGTAWRVYAQDGEVRKAVTEVTGLWHLLGETLAGLANGSVVTGLAVSAQGKVTLTDPASRIHLGIPMYSEIETLDMNFDAGDGNAEGRRARTPRLHMKVERTRGLSAGPNRESLFPMKQAQTSLVSGIIGQSLKRVISRQGRVVVRQSNPLPMHILSLFTDPQVESAPN